MSEQMVEITEAAVLQEVSALYPKVRKVTVDASNGVAYVFRGRSLKADTVRGEAYEVLAALLPASGKAAESGKDAGDKGKSSGKAADEK